MFGLEGRSGEEMELPVLITPLWHMPREEINKPGPGVGQGRGLRLWQM